MVKSLARGYGWPPEVVKKLTAPQVWFYSQIPEAAEETETQEKERADQGREVGEAIQRLSERMPQRGGKFDYWNEVLPEIDRWQKEQK